LQIPVTGMQVALDPVFGMVPLVGDAASLLLWVYIIGVAAHYGLPKRALARMMLLN
jgi:hypothetical protein